MAAPLEYLQHYPARLREQVRELIASGRLGEVLRERYPDGHTIQSNAALYERAIAIKRESMASSPPLSKVGYCDKIATLNHALGLQTHAVRVQGGKLKAKHELRVATIFKQAPLEFLDLVLVHELAHLREREHDKAFYRLCCHMLPDYHQLEFDMRMWLTWMDLRKRAASGT
ncbi:M48 family metallopeptidase [Nannocystaceae bacterium ST9]